MKKPTVKLNNGKEVLLEDFVKWHHTKQHKLTIPLEEKKAIYEKSHTKLRRAINTPLGQFPSFKEATKALGLTDSGLRNYIRNTALPLYSYVNPTTEDIAKQFHKELAAGSKKTVTPIGIFNSRIAASKALGIEDHQLKKLIREYPNEYYYADEQTNIGKRKVIKKEKPKLKFKFLKKIVTPKGDFATKKEASIALKKTSEEFEILLQSKPQKYYIKKKRVSV